MQPSVDDLLQELSAVIGALGDEGGLVSPSIYDTAQRLRFAPPATGVGPGLAWLLRQQLDDGGWGEPTAPTAQDVSTLAAVVALATYRHDAEAQSAIARGLAFLRSRAAQWGEIHLDAVPIAAEMIIPALLDDAARLGLPIDRTPYARLFALREKKLNYVRRAPLQLNSAPTYSWEALGLPYSPDVLDPRTGVGHSPAATAAWLRAAHAADASPDRIAQAEAYLTRAEASTRTGVPGVVPVVYPITGFEYSYGLYALLLTDLLDHPALREVVAGKLAEMEAIFALENSLSFGDQFVPDVDVTAIAVALFRSTGKPCDSNPILRFWNSDHFFTYTHELNPSVYSNAHALHALTLCGSRCPATERFLTQRQTADGLWIADKWHSSWRSTMLEVILALHSLGYPQHLLHAAEALMRDQRPDGSWGTLTSASYLETTYALMSLRLVRSAVGSRPDINGALARAERWLTSHAHLRQTVEVRWMGKDIYSPVRVDRAYQLATLCRVMMDAEQSSILPQSQIRARAA